MTASTRGAFLDLTLGKDLFQIVANSGIQFPVGVPALDGNDAVSSPSDDNVINGNAKNDVLRGGTGSDLLRGGKGSDLIFGDDGSDLLSGGQDNDNLDGGNGNIFLRGGRRNDTLNDDEGNNFLLGDVDFDLLTGGTNIFIIKRDVDAEVRDANLVERITDFSQEDRIAIAGSMCSPDTAVPAVKRYSNNT